MPNKEKRDSWLDLAVSDIFFSLDREEVRAELQEHIEDKTLDLQRIFPGMTEEEALDRALAGMGDAEELKESLAKVHHSWLGRIWVLARVIYAFTAVVLFALVLMYGCLMGDWEMREGVFGRPETAWNQEVRDRSVVLMPDKTRVVSDGCVVTMERAWLVEDPEGGWTVQIGLLVRSWEFWIEERNFIWRLDAVDDQGNPYPTDVPEGQEPTPYVRGRRSPIESPIWASPFKERYILSVHGVDPDFETLRLEYDWMGRSFTMTVTREEAGL